jgi:stage II sporulation protein D
MRRYMVYLTGILVIVLLIVPVALVMALGRSSLATNHSHPAPGDVQLQEGDAVIKVYRTQTHKVETMPLEAYVAGVVAGEMPIQFELQALEAQAIAARTRAVQTLIHHSPPKLPEAANAGADITDSYLYDQAYSSLEQLKREWGAQYRQNLNKLYQAVNATKGKILTYNGTIIDALYFSTSNGYTEDAKNYWGKEIAYLKSVPSPWDTVAPRYKQQTVIPIPELLQKLDIHAVSASAGNKLPMRVLAVSQTNHVTKIQVGDKVLTGRQFREALQLNSTSFTWNIVDNNVYFQTEGYGHDTGMSQYGANGMAKEGKTADQILKYYYQGVTITDSYPYLASAGVLKSKNSSRGT